MTQKKCIGLEAVTEKDAGGIAASASPMLGKKRSGSGNDAHLAGGGAADDSLFGRGDGHEVVVSDGKLPGEVDQAHLGQGIAGSWIEGQSAA